MPSEKRGTSLQLEMAIRVNPDEPEESETDQSVVKEAQSGEDQFHFVGKVAEFRGVPVKLPGATEVSEENDDVTK